jgi:tetratricopeptide (TPR) repeat protein
MAENLYKQAVAIARLLSETKPLLAAEALYELASYYNFQEKDNEAELLWKELKTYNKYFASTHCIYVQTIFGLARLEERKGNFDAAEILYKELLEKQENDLGDESLDICPILEQLASFYCRQNKYSLAEALNLRILVIKEFYLGTCSPEINSTVDALINIFKKLSKWRLAEYMMNRQKGILLALHGKDSLCLASCALRLSELQTATKQINRAIENLSFAIEVYKNKFGELTNPIISLQNKLDILLIHGVEMNFSPFDNSADSHASITVNLKSSNIASVTPSLIPV